jgi:hypothetical protein
MRIDDVGEAVVCAGAKFENGNSSNYRRIRR